MKSIFISLFIGAVVLAVTCQGAVVRDGDATTSKPTASPWYRCPNNAPGFYPNPYDCHKYFLCDGANAWAFECPGHLFFNPNTQGCDFPGNVDCNPIVTSAP
ncbi:major mite allergen Der p 23-like [Ischnura elegans]|uniref:major mite allergen Der p 23-like n=1 Tax=Ischnura elegans TaxID=197161 RepID=UPI001ED8A3E4|nr:major mite allergen Der p 23-like [Ischnura elegans]